MKRGITAILILAVCAVLYSLHLKANPDSAEVWQTTGSQPLAPGINLHEGPLLFCPDGEPRYRIGVSQAFLGNGSLYCFQETYRADSLDFEIGPTRIGPEGTFTIYFSNGRQITHSVVTDDDGSSWIAPRQL